MDIAAVALVLGMLPLLFLPQLPPPMLIGGLALAMVICWRRTTSAYCQYAAWLLCGLVLACGSAQQLTSQIAVLSGKPLHLTVSVASVALANHEPGKVLLRVEQVNGRWLFPALSFSAYWKHGPWCAGQRWQLKARLRPVHSRLNQGGFDSQRWAIARRQPLSGYVQSATPIDAGCSWRQRIVSAAQRRTEGLPHQGTLLALAFGERTLLSQGERNLFLKTGIAHLMAISGLHISLAAMVAWCLLRLMQFTLPVGRIGYRGPLIASLLAALGYVWLAGAQPPAVRALLALTLWTLIRLRGICCTSWQIWLWCVCLILLSDPLAVLSDSFWLSVLAVAALIFWFEWAALPSRFSAGWYWAPLRWLHIQLGMTLLLMPMQFGLFHGVTWTSLPANLWAVPIVSLLSVPLILFAIISGAGSLVAGGFWRWADLSLTWAMWPLPWLEQGWLRVGSALLPFSVLGWLVVVGWRLRCWAFSPCSCIAVLLCCLTWRERQPDYRWRVDMLDVGHGLAVVIERDGKAVMYDTGARWASGSMAEREILPYLHWRGLELEKVIISHSHQDHMGGLSTVQRAFPLAVVYSPLYAPGHYACVRGQQWQWRGLNFRVLWPPQRLKQVGNDDSCTIRVDDGKFSLLLTGDLEARGESALLKLRAELPSTLLQVPHHGSKTSSTPPFLRAVAPAAALASASRYNQWRLPAEKIIKRYRSYRIAWHDTSRSGQLSVLFFDNDWQIKGFREQLMPRWYHQRFGERGDNE